MAKAVKAPVAQPRRIAVLGAGSWGTTFAKILADGDSDVVLWARRPELAR
ncbi:MAG: glycerol-3-phosphate dehydrogenase, partial [Leifsonia sp.]|nr:glycerol-3-phosphate dehydrogenase [Leifsonia sp.]